ncbi:GNAT family N-acetyltransferase [Paenibacillus sp. J22TS3]|uniref:GNAT family N-acetyltransferase n=1 Tax=Paenibacillus sp. J22TS3 TaxID=2807192 RepID=UPI001B0C8278|nr:GNAT family N-acetyltransferase [Paenibacillus sp. J22TS3]GIP21631.1 N-acetyltransferase [Paenibacillus sp. J22TS3]
MRIELAGISDIPYILEHDRHLPPMMVRQKIEQQEIYMLRDEEDQVIGWLRYGYFWDNIPFMNMLWIHEEYRGQGMGRSVVTHWEREMYAKGFRLVMTSSLSNEQAQHFYRQLGYMDAGSLLLQNEPMEIIFTKTLNAIINFNEEKL